MATDPKSVGKGLSVLVVDDDSVAQKIHKALLDKYGFQTQVVKNGEEAIMLCRSGIIFDLVLMDKEMSILDGVHATRELRAMGIKSKIVGVTTSIGPGADMHEFVEAGLDLCLSKPLNPDIVFDLVNIFFVKA